MSTATSRAQPAVAVDTDADSAPQVTRWERLSFSIMRSALSVQVAVFGLPGLYRACKFFGLMEYLVNFKRRRRVRGMMRKVYGKDIDRKERRRMMRRLFMRQRCDKAFYLIFDTLPLDVVRSRFSIVNQHLLDEGLARGNGVYSLLCHHGAHHVSGMIMSVLGYRVGAVRDPKEGAMRRYIQSLWENKHPELPRAKMLYAGDFARTIYRALKENYAIGSALDVSRVRETRLKTVPVNIYGETREFLTGTLQIALRCKSTVIQSFIISEDNFHYRLELMGPMTDPETDHDTPELRQRLMQAYADNIADYVRRYPDHITRV